MAREPQLITYDKWSIAEALALTSTGTPSSWVPSLPIGEEDDTTILLAPDDYVRSILLREYGNRVILETPDLTDAQMIAAMKQLWEDWWSTREHEYAFLADAFLREYSPIENYDRYEEGSIVDEHDIGARSGTDNLTDTYAATQKTTTDTPGVTETLTHNIAATSETVTETPKVDTTVTDTFGATQETVTETPRAETTTTTTPGVVMETQRDIYGDNSSTAVPVDKTTVTPDATTPDVVTVAGTAGTNTTVTADLQKIDTHKTEYDGTNEVKTDTTARIDSDVTTFAGFNQSIEAETQHIDTHNRTTGSLAAKDTDTRTWDGYHVHGNIGVMTVADMLAKEVEIRSGIDLALMAIREFVNKFTFYAEAR